MKDLVKKQDSYYEASRTDMLKYIDTPPRRILEVGCGAGNFSRNFTDVEYWGVEPNSAMSAQAAKISHKVLTGTYDAVEAEIPDGYFDLIVCNDVIEHMVDPIAFLRSARTKLNANGKFIASVPNIRYAPLLFDLVFRGDFDYQVSGPLDYTHLHLFTVKSFAKMASDCGWRVELTEPLAILPFKPWNNLILRILERGRKDMRNAQFVVRLSPA